MKTVEEARRVLFEAWHNEKALQMAGVKEYQAIISWVTHKEVLWCGFQAALDAVCVELPSEWPPVTEKDEGANEMLEDCRAAIEQTGLGLKVL